MAGVAITTLLAGTLNMVPLGLEFKFKFKITVSNEEGESREVKKKG